MSSKERLQKSNKKNINWKRKGDERDRSGRNGQLKVREGERIPNNEGERRESKTL